MAVRVSVGAAEIVALRDGEHPLDRAWHFPGVPAQAWEGQDGRPLNFGGYLVETDGKVVLVDTGWGPYLGPPGGLARPAALLEELAEAGYTPAEVDLVVFTHLHPDHVGWNLVLDPGQDPRPRFPNARYLVPRADWEHYRDLEHKHPNIVQQALPLEELGVLRLIEDGHRVTPSLRAVALPGHTPGHTGYALGDREAFLLGDLAHHPVVLRETGWAQRFDFDPEQAVATRERTLAELEDTGTLVAFGHFPHPGLGHVIRKEGRRAWLPW
ncbi:MBL fold metallo-hydrolase [Sphaerisporangium krabiense]|uniref:Glyoxylase-like metal-dependent hydrolase (Beta-lactamase superfamily II) n=1 Tax=Sphaerisporangium krabiense TaxID=763782 RepID=A0A7W9DUT8_9ACTN|nr:MBL fold metallo-hydrolase [Sphaerisporangium krabiense]MBB5631389.1 glyoxylase-like metal-dependent hydrolase (beta-lactamase superfamily II) [Sphaerisporangium krabiense]GII60807.1 MBL fold metallo-hydrolase [Sphaerisporangium krabiense]